MDLHFVQKEFLKIMIVPLELPGNIFQWALLMKEGQTIYMISFWAKRLLTHLCLLPLKPPDHFGDISPASAKFKIYLKESCSPELFLKLSFKYFWNFCFIWKLSSKVWQVQTTLELFKYISRREWVNEYLMEKCLSEAKQHLSFRLLAHFRLELIRGLTNLKITHQIKWYLRNIWRGIVKLSRTNNFQLRFFWNKSSVSRYLHTCQTVWPF